MGEGSIVRLPVEAFDRLAVQKHPAGAGAQRPGQQLGDGGLAAAAFPHDGGHAPLREYGGYAVQRLPPRCIGKMHVLQLQPPAAGLYRTPCGLWFLQQRQHHSPRADPVHGHVEGASEGTERQEELRRHQHQKERGGNASAVLRSRYRQCRTDSCAAKGHKVHDGHAGQLHDKDFHGDFPKFLGVLVHIRLPPCVRAEELQLLQPLHAV